MGRWGARGEAGPRVGNGVLVDVESLDIGAEFEVCLLTVSTTGVNKLLNPSTNANRPCCCDRPRSMPYIQNVH